MTMPPEISYAITRLENAVREAARKDMQAEMTETWEPTKLKRSQEAWDKAKAIRIELEAAIIEAIK